MQCFLCHKRTLIYPFDKWTWLLLGISIVSIALALAFVNIKRFRQKDFPVSRVFKKVLYNSMPPERSTLCRKTTPSAVTSASAYPSSLWSARASLTSGSKLGHSAGYLNQFDSFICYCHLILCIRYGMVLLFTWFPLGLLVSLAYKSTLLASLVAVQKEKSVQTFQVKTSRRKKSWFSPYLWKWQEVLDNKMTFALHSGYLTTILMRDSAREEVR